MILVRFRLKFSIANITVRGAPREGNLTSLTLFRYHFFDNGGKNIEHLISGNNLKLTHGMVFCSFFTFLKNLLMELNRVLFVGSHC